MLLYLYCLSLLLLLLSLPVAHCLVVGCPLGSVVVVVSLVMPLVVVT